jgi:polyisoprenoid-binding protein YceI
MALVVFAALTGASSAASAATYKIDKDHSSVGFSIRHLFSKVRGQFKDFSGTFDYTPGQPEQWKANATIQAASIDTNVEPRDKHLRSADFFDTAQFPAITFTSTQVTEATAERAKLHGTLSLRGVEKPVVLDVAIHGEGTDPWGNVRSGFTATTTINRKDFGLNWNETLETGQVLVGEEVEITLEIEGIKQ